MSKSVKDILKEKGPMLSGELARIYEIENNTNNTNARQVLSRSRSPIQKNKHIPFKNNQVFFYLEEQFAKTDYLENLEDAIHKESKITYSVINAIKNNSGYISKDFLTTLVSSPVENLKGHKRFDTLIGKMKDSCLIEDYLDDYYTFTSPFSKALSVKLNFSHSKALEIAKKTILADYNDLTKKINSISYNQGKVIGNFGKFNWAFTAPSYLQGIASFNLKTGEMKPGFVIVDLIFKDYATIEDIAFFLEKISIIRSMKNISNFIPILLVKTLEKDAHELLKKNNVMICFLNILFGKEYIQLLSDLVNIMTNATAMVLKNPEKIDEVFDSLVNSEGRYNNVVGSMFELLVANFYNSIGVTYLEVNKIIKGYDTKTGNPKEIDVFLKKNGKIINVECKAYRSPISIDFIKEWIQIKIPDIFHAEQKNNTNQEIEFEIWSVSGYDDEALELLQKSENSVKKYKISHYDKSSMLEKAREYKASNFIKQLNQHFSY